MLIVWVGVEYLPYMCIPTKLVKYKAGKPTIHAIQDAIFNRVLKVVNGVRVNWA